MAGYADQIIAILEPKVGAVMAVSAVKNVCKKQGINFSDITRENIPVLAEGLFIPLKVFAGDEFAQMIVHEIKKIQ